jgi:hypothetical protein
VLPQYWMHFRAYSWFDNVLFFQRRIEFPFCYFTKNYYYTSKQYALNLIKITVKRQFLHVYGLIGTQPGSTQLYKRAAERFLLAAKQLQIPQCVI